jgi:hypothetical protein
VENDHVEVGVKQQDALRLDAAHVKQRRLNTLEAVAHELRLEHGLQTERTWHTGATQKTSWHQREHIGTCMCKPTCGLLNAAC